MRTETHSDISTGKFDTSASGDLELIAGDPTRWIYIHHINWIRTQNTTTVQFKYSDGTTTVDITPAFKYDTAALESTLPDASTYIRIPPGNSFIVENSAAVQIQGLYSYSFRY